MGKPSSKLTPRQIAFVHAYMKHGVAERAAIEAGYSERAARQTGSRMLTNANVAREIKRLAKAVSQKAEIDIQKIVDEFTLIGFADLAEFVTWGAEGVVLKESGELDAAKRRAIIEVSEGRHGIKIKLADKNTALDRLGKYLGMFIDKVEHSVSSELADLLKARRERARNRNAGGE